MPNTGGLSPGTTILEVTGTKSNDSILISDNGTGAAGNIFVSVAGGQDYMSTGAVSEVAVATGTGNDRVTYEPDGDLQANVNELVFVGSNKKGGGSFQFTVNVTGRVLDGASLGIVGLPDPRKTTSMSVNDTGEVDGSLTAILSTLGGMKSAGGGPEVYNFRSTATIGPDGLVLAGLRGSTRNDVASVSYSGTNDGELDISEQGNGGNYQLSADVYMVPGSTGTVGSMNRPSSIIASGKKDNLQFTIQDGNVPSSVVDLNIFALIQSKSKNDKIKKTANVQSITPGTVTIVS
jgi:hypothetical protein